MLAGALLLAPASRAGDAFEPVGIADAGQIVDVGEPVTFSLVQLVNRSGAPVTTTDVRLLPDTHGYPPLHVLRAGVLVGQQWAGGLLPGALSKTLPGAVLTKETVIPAHRAGDTYDAILLFEVSSSTVGIAWMPTEEISYVSNGVQHQQRFDQGVMLCAPVAKYTGPGHPFCDINRRTLAGH